ncbi:MAG: hypothetical protein CVU46_00150 [Chloroflexi bacterium HGW-Chloroflexi-8]|nr:MAG: hypothetical protein CVU46_00150 [Chloroflexi bacterium HGW-Chloroflexi-8]
MTKVIYDNDFFSKHDLISYKSAVSFVPILFDLFEINSVVDIGCGIGSWLKAFQDHGVTNIKGYDVSNLQKSDYLVPYENLELNFDFISRDFPNDKKYDILLCLEVVEHLPEKKSFEFIKKLTELSPVILFSAAIPGQSGHGHINEQYPSFWNEIFQKFSFIEIDFIKPLIWNNYEIAWWYRQNMTIYVNRELLIQYPKLYQISKKINEQTNEPKLILVSETIFKEYNKKIIRKILNKLIKRNTKI